MNFFSALTEIFPFFSTVRSGSGYHSASNTMATEGSYPGGQADSGMKLTTFIYCWGLERVLELYRHFHLSLNGVSLY